MKILLTGATGLLGSAIIRRFGSEHEFVTVGRAESSESNVYSHLFFDFSSLREFDPGPLGLDAVIHLAQSRSFREFPDKASETFNINTKSTLNLLEYCRRNHVGTFLLASTGGLYQPGTSPLIEHDPLRKTLDLDMYFASKMAAESLCGAYSKIFNIIITRIFFMYGNNQDHQQLIPRLISSVREGKPIHLGGINGFRLNPIHVTDAAHHLINLLKARASGVFNVAGTEVVSLRELCQIIGNALGREPVFECVAPQKDLVACTRMLDVLGGNPSTSLEIGLRQVI